MKLLLVEDDAELARQLNTELAGAGYDVAVFRDGLQGREAALQEKWDLAVLDVSLPYLNGFEIVKQMRSEGVDIPVIFLTAKGDVNDRIQGLSDGGDDYLTKPFSMDELKARLLALSRRYGGGSPAELRLPEGWSLDRLLREVTVRGKAVPLQPREWSLLNLFLAHHEEVLTNTFVLDQVWGIQFDPGTNVINATICRLRKKLDDPGHPSHIETIRSRGYRFRSDV